MYLKDASSLLLFVLVESTNGPTIFLLGFSELRTENTTALKIPANDFLELEDYCLALSR